MTLDMGKQRGKPEFFVQGCGMVPDFVQQPSFDINNTQEGDYLGFDEVVIVEDEDKAVRSLRFR